MDRNRLIIKNKPSVGVALRKESVDRNTLPKNPVIGINKSLSARRAWIEIMVPSSTVIVILVALRKESVDRNKNTKPAEQAKAVALRKESVDRNSCWLLA